MDPISYFQAIVLGIVQGLAEPFPISSLGHAVVLPHLFGWNIHQNDDYFLAFLVATHLATAIVLFFFFLKDWLEIFRGIGRSLRDREIRADDTYAKLGWLLVVGTIPAGILGLLLEHSLRSVFASASAAAAFLILNGILLLLFERWRTRAPAPDDWKGDADHRRRGGAEDPRPPRERRRSRARAGPRRRAVRRRGHLPRREVPAPLLPDEPPDAVRRLLHLRRRTPLADLRSHMND